MSIVINTLHILLNHHKPSEVKAIISHFTDGKMVAQRGDNVISNGARTRVI